MKYDEMLDEITVRFLINLPPADYEYVERLVFVLEEAHWYYLDFMKGERKLFRNFIYDILEHIEYPPVDVDYYLRIFGQYKYDVPVYGALIFNRQMNYILLNKGCNRRSQFMFPRGKKCMNETGTECAIREVYEEIGYDISNKISKVVIRPEGKRYTLYFVFNVPMDTKFKSQTRNEISEIKWFNVNDIQNSTTMELSQIKTVYLTIKEQIDRIRRNRFRFNREKMFEQFDNVLASV